MSDTGSEDGFGDGEEPISVAYILRAMEVPELVGHFEGELFACVTSCVELSFLFPTLARKVQS